MEHSKLPWKKVPCKLHHGHFDIVGSDGRIITCIKGDREDYSEFIVKACNAHDDLMGLLDNVLKGVDVDLGACQRLYNEIEGL